MKAWLSVLASVFIAFLLLIIFLPAQGADKIVTVPPVDVQVIAVGSQDLPKEITSLGTLKAPDSVTLSSDVDGHVKQIYFKNGSTVGKGMPVLQLDDTEQQVGYQKAVAKLDADSRLLERQLKAAEALSQQQIETTKALVESDKADVKAKQAALNRMKIVAPISGVLGSFAFNVGDYIKSGDPIVTLVNTAQLRVDYDVPADDVNLLQRGQSVSVTSDSYPNKMFTGSVTYISPSVDPSTRTIAVQALLPNQKSLLRPGMFVHIEQEVSMQKGALVVPQMAIIAGVKGYSVYVVENSRAVQKPLMLGNRFKNMVVVKSGLQLGDKVVVSGQDKLQDGGAVNVLPGQPHLQTTPAASAPSPQPQASQNSAKGQVAPAQKTTPTQNPAAPAGVSPGVNSAVAK